MDPIVPPLEKFSVCIPAMAKQVERSGKTVADLHCSIAAREAAERRQKELCCHTEAFEVNLLSCQKRIAHTNVVVFLPLIQLQIAGNHPQPLWATIHNLSGQPPTTPLGNHPQPLIATIHNPSGQPSTTPLGNHPQLPLGNHPQLPLGNHPQPLWATVAQRGCGWLPRGVVDGCPEEHFLTTLHVQSTDAAAITEAYLLCE